MKRTGKSGVQFKISKFNDVVKIFHNVITHNRSTNLVTIISKFVNIVLIEHSKTSFEKKCFSAWF